MRFNFYPAQGAPFFPQIPFPPPVQLPLVSMGLGNLKLQNVAISQMTVMTHFPDLDTDIKGSCYSHLPPCMARRGDQGTRAISVTRVSPSTASVTSSNFSLHLRSKRCLYWITSTMMSLVTFRKGMLTFVYITCSFSPFKSPCCLF